MELRAVLESLKWLALHHKDRGEVHLITDSQYIAGLPIRKEKLVTNFFNTNKNESIRNSDLVQEFYEIISSFELLIEKVKTHQKKNDDQYDGNREVDQLCRKVMRSVLNK